MTKPRSIFASILQASESRCAADAAAKVFLISAVWITISAIVFESAEEFTRTNGALLQTVEYLIITFSMAEYLMRLLTLDAGDFRRLLNAHPDLKNQIIQVAQERRPA